MRRILPLSSAILRELVALSSAEETRAWIQERAQVAKELEAGEGEGLNQDFVQAVALHGTHWDPSLVHLVAERWQMLDLLVQNPSLPAPHRQAMGEMALRSLEGWDRAAARQEYPAQATEALRTLIAGGSFRMAGPEGKRFFALLESNIRGRETVGRELLDLLLLAPDTPAAFLVAMVRYVDVSHHARLAAHPSAHFAVWAEMLKRSWTEATVLAISEVPQARLHPTIRRALRGYAAIRAAVYLRLLVQDGIAEEFPSLLEDLFRQDPEQAADVLRRASPAQLACLKREDLLPLLASPLAELRMVAIAVEGRLGEAVRAVEPQPRSRR